MKVNITKLSLCGQHDTKHLAGIKSQERVGAAWILHFQSLFHCLLLSTTQCPYLQNGEMVFGGGLVSKSCPTLATPWTVAHQAPLSM